MDGKQQKTADNERGIEMRTVSYIKRTKTVAPFIRLSGKKLAELGFGIANKFEVEYKQNEIILRSTK